MLDKITLLFFVLFSCIGLVPPWFVDFQAIDPKYSALEVILLLLTGGVCLVFCRLADQKRTKNRSQGGSLEDRA